MLEKSGADTNFDRVRLSRIGGQWARSALDRFGDSRHVIGVFRERREHRGQVKRNVDAFDRKDRNKGANALQGMSHPSILAKQDRPETDIEREDSWAPPY